MKSFFSVFVTIFCVTLFSAEIEISKLKTVFYADKSSAPAARELAMYLGRIFGTRIAVKAADRVGKSGFYIGKAFAPANIKADNREAIFQQITDDGKIILWGAENSRQIPGDFYAVTTFLENECGVRWLWPGDSGEVIPEKKSLKLAAGLKNERPAFAVRILKYGGEANWKRRMKLGQSINYTVGHAFSKFINPKQYFKQHPEYFGLVSPGNWVGSGDKPDKPTRSPRQLCTSNPDVRRIIAEKVAAKKTADMQSISPNDGYGFCECANCRAQDAQQWTSIHDFPNLSDRMYDFVRDVALQAKKLNPESKVLLNAYTFCAKPPKKVYKMPDNVFVLRCLFGAAVKDRKEIEAEFEYYKNAGIGLWLYEYWGCYNQGMPWNVINMISWEAKLLKSVNGFGMRVESASQYANSGVTNYIGAKLLWNPDADVNLLLDDYCRAGFGNAAEPLKQYFNLVEKYTAKVFDLSWGGYSKVLYSIGIVFNDEFFKQGDALFKQAARAKISAKERIRVEYVRSGYELSKTIAAWSRMLSQVNAHGGNLPLVHPTENEPAEISDETLLKLYTEAYKICEKKHLQSLAGAMKQNHAITYNDRLERTLWHMPYNMGIQKLMKGVQIGFANYFINNAFELRNLSEDKNSIYGWRVNGGKVELTLQDCHDDTNDVTAMYHGKQGCALSMTLKPGETATLTSAVKVVQPAGTRMVVSGWFKNGEPEVVVNFDIDGTKRSCKLAVAAKGLKESTNWQEITYTPFNFPAGKKVSATISFVFNNRSNVEQKVLLDDLKFKKAK